MKTVIRNSYTPKLGDYCETIVVDKETGTAYIFDEDGVWTELDQTDVEAILVRAAQYTDEQVAPLSEKLETIEEGAQVNKIEHILRNGTELTITNKTVNVTVPTKTSDLTNDGSDGTDTYVESATLDDYYTKTETDTQIGYETTAREIADAGLQEQIDAIAAASDVVDIVGTYAALQAYDTSKLHDNDIIKVLTDETRDDATTYYRWDADTSTWSYIGAEGPFYTKAESDAIFTPMTRTINNKALSSDITLTAADVGALPDSTVIPTVNDATLTIQQNGTTVQTFTANQASNATANIIVPTDTSDLTNGAGYITSAALPTKTSDLTNDGSDGTSTYVEADDLATVATTGSYSDLLNIPTFATVATTGDYDDLLNKPTIPTVNDATLTIQKNGTDVVTFTANSSTNQTANITVPTDTSDLTNGAGFITTAALANYYTKNETYSQQEVNGLISAIVVPTKTSDLTNDGSDGTSTYVEASDLATVATTGAYSDLIGAPGDFTGTDGQSAGTHGLVPAPTTSDVDKYLKSDGTWSAVQGGGANILHGMIGLIYDPMHTPHYSFANDYSYNDIVAADGVFLEEASEGVVYQVIGYEEELYTGHAIVWITADGENIIKLTFDSTSALTGEWSKFTAQEKLVAGSNISIAADGKTVSAPTNVSAFTNDAGYLTSSSLSNYYTKSETYSQQETNALINAITVPTKTSDLINDGDDGVHAFLATDDVATVATSGDYDDLINKPTIPSYSDFTGATSSTAGAHGLVPAPAAGDEDKYLKADGTWATVQSGGATTTFYWDDSGGAMYKDNDYTDLAAYSDIATAMRDGVVYIQDRTNTSDYTVVADDRYNFNITAVANISSANIISVFTYDSMMFSWSRTDTGVQPKLTAGTNITISNDTISASIPIDSALNVSSTNPVENSVVTAAINDKSDKFVIMKYGETNAWAKFIDAYNNNKIVYCRASSNSNPASGAQTRLAFMAYVSAETNPTSVEFQYVRSVNSKSDSQQSDQVFVYKLTNASGGTWTVESRNMAPKINVSGPITKTFTTGANATITIGANAMTGATSGAAGAAGVVPAPAAGDEGKFLKGDGTWATVTSGQTYTAGTGINISAQGVISAVTTTFIWDDPDMKDMDRTAVTGAEVMNAFYAGGANILDASFLDGTEGVVIEYYTDGSDQVFVVQYTDIPTGTITNKKITYNGSTWSETAYTLAKTTDLPSNFTGATTLQAGTAGLVPAPTTSDPDKYLKGDGTWATIASASTISSADWSALWQ